jgi:hypothetical protein
MSYTPNYDHDEEYERNHAAMGVNPSFQPSTKASRTSSMTSLQPEFRLVSVRRTVLFCIFRVSKGRPGTISRHGR